MHASPQHEAAKPDGAGMTLDSGQLIQQAPIRQAPPRRPLTRAACLALLAPGGHGRVAATMRAVPIIIPVRFTLVGGEVVFRVALGAGLARAVANSVVAFETDQIGSDGHAVWDIHVTGVAKPLADEPRGPTFRLSSDIMTGW